MSHGVFLSFSNLAATCQIPKRFDYFNIQFREFESLRGLVIIRLTSVVIPIVGVINGIIHQHDEVDYDDDDGDDSDGDAR